MPTPPGRRVRRSRPTEADERSVLRQPQARCLRPPKADSGSANFDGRELGVEGAILPQGTGDELQLGADALAFRVERAIGKRKLDGDDGLVRRGEDAAGLAEVADERVFSPFFRILDSFQTRLYHDFRHLSQSSCSSRNSVPGLDVEKTCTQDAHVFEFRLKPSAKSKQEFGKNRQKRPKPGDGCGGRRERW